MAIALGAGDGLRITDPEGLQTVDLLLIDPPQGEPADAMPVIGAEALVTQLPSRDEATSAALRLLRDAGTVRRSAALAADQRATAWFDWVAPWGVVAVVTAPGAPMAPQEQHPTTDIEVEIFRKSRAPSAPPPLADVLLDLHVPAAEARAYRVKAGDYIQIVDIDGRQCSDFLAFDAALLADGTEKGLDATTTRTLMGSAFPGPGLHSKYFDEDMRPLIEVIRDTVGRHDTFALACTAKYYEDAGYPGHPNCSDNFNAVLEPYGVKPRKGWPAINFFYNTAIGGTDVLTFDEPWSRPGDYVLLRALTDLVCASSSCADDIDPANGWNPTDIRVRVYDGATPFSKGSVFRMTPDAEPRLTRETAFHPRIAAMTRGLVDYRGFWLPTSFPDHGAIAEYWACREGVAVMDLSPLRKFEVTGPDAEALLQRAVTRDMAKLSIGQIVYTALCYDHGGMIDDATVIRLGANNFRVVAGDDVTGLWLRQKARDWGLEAWVRASTDQLHNLAVQGPKSRDLLAQIVVTGPSQPSIADLKLFRFTIGRLGHAAGPSIVVSRTGYTGELGYEVWCHPRDGLALWDAIAEAGAPMALTPLGLDALDMLRIEAGLVFAHYDFDDGTDPFEAGIGFVVPDKAADYVGREAVLRRKAHPSRKLVGLDLDGRDAIGHGDPVFIGRAQVGVVTSATRSPILDKTIALARLDVVHAAVGTAIEIGKLDGHRKRLGARVTSFPHYDPTKSRVRS